MGLKREKIGKMYNDLRNLLGKNCLVIFFGFNMFTNKQMNEVKKKINPRHGEEKPKSLGNVRKEKECEQKSQKKIEKHQKQTEIL